MLRAIKKIIKSEIYFFLITPAFLWQLFFLILPIMFVLGLSVYTGSAHNLFQNFSFDNFKEVLHWPQFIIIGRSVLLASVTAWVCLLLAYPIAYFLALYIKRYRFVFLFLVSLPFLINILVQVYAWFFILERHGLLNNMLLFFGIIQKPIDMLNSYFSIYLVMFHVYLPFMIMPIYAVLEKLNVRLIEASDDLGASFLKTLWHVILPLSMPGVRSGFFLVYVTSFGEYVIPSLLGGLKKFFVGTLISEYFFIGKDWHVGAAVTCFSCGVLLLTVLFYSFVFDKLTMRSRKIGRY